MNYFYNQKEDSDCAYRNSPSRHDANYIIPHANNGIGIEIGQNNGIEIGQNWNYNYNMALPPPALKKGKIYRKGILIACAYFYIEKEDSECTYIHSSSSQGAFHNSHNFFRMPLGFTRGQHMGMHESYMASNKTSS